MRYQIRANASAGETWRVSQVLCDLEQPVNTGQISASGVIATFGLLSNSPAVIIGAMIVAPLV